MTVQKEYLGDSVYAEYDGHTILLTTNNDLPGDPRNKIYLESLVYQSLERFVAKIREKEISDGTTT